jgi:transcriptional regulator with XRE-family HTH domain
MNGANINPKVFGSFIARRRGVQSLRSLARELGIGHVTLYRIECGEVVPSLPVLVKLCEWAGLNVLFDNIPGFRHE